MQVRDDMIDEELRDFARKARVMRKFTSRLLFRAMDFGMRLGAKKVPDNLRCEEQFVTRSTDAGNIRVCVYRAKDAITASADTGQTVDAALPMFLYLHGGGYAIGNPEMSAGVYAKFIATRECIIVAPAYRKSLEAPFPAALDDCYDTLLWMRDNATSLGGDPGQIIVGGHSGGGGLTAAVSLRARARQDVPIALQLPIYPMLDDRNTTNSMVDSDAPGWNETTNQLAWHLYLQGLTDDVPQEAAPARAADYADLPPTITFVGDLDPFRDETIQYVENLRAHGVPVRFELFKGGYHAFEIIVPTARLSQAADAFLYSAFAEALDALASGAPKPAVFAGS